MSSYQVVFIQENTKTDIVDINMGCPVNKIVKNEAGAMWLKDPDKIYSIINKVQSVLDIPLTVKMRTGWADPSLAVENALAAEAAGVSALAMHGRTREQMYTGHADLETLHKVAQALTKIPLSPTVTSVQFKKPSNASKKSVLMQL